MDNATIAVIFRTKLSDFIGLIQRKTDENFTENFPTLISDAISYECGQKYIRIIKQGRTKDALRARIVNTDRCSVWGFIAIYDNPKKNEKTGDILKAAGWKTPAKHSRGSIFAADPWQGMDVYGPAYLK
jgi:hypothetical protein